MDPNLRLLSVGAAVRTLGNALYFPFLALFLYSVLGVTYLEIGVLILLVGLVQLPFGLAGGLLADRYGRRPLVLLGLAGEAAATAGLALAFGYASLVGAVLAATAGGAIATVGVPAMQAYIADVAHGSERTRGFTWYRIGFNAGFSAGVTLGGVLITLVGYAPSVGVGACIVLIAFGVLFVGLDPSPFDRARVAASSRSNALPSSTLRPPSVRASLAVMVRDRVALEVALAFALASLVAGQWAVTFPLYVHNILGVSYSLLGIGLALNGLLVVFGQAPMTERAVGHRHTRLAEGGVVLYVLALVGLGAAGEFALDPTIAFFVAVVVLTLGENLGAIPMTTLPSNLAPPGEIGAYNGAFSTLSSVGFLLSVLLGGYVLSLTADPLLIWVYLMLPAIPAVWLLRDAGARLRAEVDRA